MTDILTDLELVRAPLAPCGGVPSLVQGTYGQVGNLELVFPDAQGGLWVHWRNLDPDDVRPGARAGGWSAGLRVASDRHFDASSTIETAETRSLVVVASAGGEVLTTAWTAEAGFGAVEPVGVSGTVAGLLQAPGSRELLLLTVSDAGMVAVHGSSGSGAWSALEPTRYLDPARATPIVAASTFFTAAGELGMVVVRADGELWLVGRPGGPRWLASGVGAGVVALVDPDGRLEVIAVDADAGLRLWSESRDDVFASSLGRVDAVAACRVDRGGRGIAAVARVGDRLWWCPALPGDEAANATQVVESDAWAPVDVRSINGRDF